MPRCSKGHTYSSIGGCPLCGPVRPARKTRPKGASPIRVAPPRQQHIGSAGKSNKASNSFLLRGRIDSVQVRSVESPASIRWAFKAAIGIVALNILFRMAFNNFGFLIIVCAFLVLIGSLSKVLTFVLGLAFRPVSSHRPHRPRAIAFLRVDCGSIFVCRLTGSEAIIPAQGDEVSLLTIPTFTSRFVISGRNRQTGRMFVTAALLPAVAGIFCVLFVIGALR